MNLPHKDTNILEVAWPLQRNLISILEEGDVWTDVAEGTGIFCDGTIRQIDKSCSPGHALFQELGNRNATVDDLIYFLEKCNLTRALMLLKEDEPLKIIGNPAEHTVVSVEGELRLMCTATGFPQPQYQWFKDEEELVGEHGQVLKIEKFVPQDAGKYHCQVSQESRHGGPAVILNCACAVVDVAEEAPCIQQQFQSQQVIHNETVCFACEAVGYPTVKYQWYRFGEPVHGQTEPTLKIEEARFEDGGQYHCHVTNVKGEAWAEYELTVLCNGSADLSEVPEIIIQPRLPNDEKIRLGSYVFLTCRAKCRWKFSYEWLKNGKSMGVHEPTLLVPITENYAPSTRFQCLVRSCGPGKEIVPSVEVCVKVESSLYDIVHTALDKVALLIGNDTYQHHPDLNLSVIDTETLSECLTELQFQVIALKNLTLVQMRNAVNFFCDHIVGEQVYALFYFAGHGFAINEETYMVPVDAPHESQYSRTDNFYEQEVIGRMLQKCLGLCVVLMDTCRTQPVRNTKILHEAPKIWYYHANRNLIKGYATTSHFKAYEREKDKNGIYMKYLQKYIRRPIPIQDVLMHVAQDIKTYESCSKSWQMMPFIANNLTDNCYCLTDKIQYPQDNSYHVRTLEFERIQKLPAAVYFETADQDYIKFLSFQRGYFLNAMEMHIDIPDGVGGINVAVDPECDGVGLKVMAENGKCKAVYNLVNLQELKTSLKVTIFLGDVQIPVDMGLPLIAPVHLWRNNMSIMNQADSLQNFPEEELSGHILPPPWKKTALLGCPE